MSDFILSILSGLLIGCFLAFIYGYKSKQTKSMTITLILMPAIVAMVIICVNGNLGAGVAVAGAFSLVRFRSIPGTAEEIVSIFLAMTAGIGCGMGYELYAGIFAGVLGMVSLLFRLVSSKSCSEEKILHITVPEDLNYSEAFAEVIEKYTSSYSLIGVKTSNMGSLYKLTYSLNLRPEAREKELIDELRCRNGNLEISLMQKEVNINAL